MNEYLIKALKNGRAKKGLKQSDVASLLGVKGGTLSNYENGISEPDIDTFATLCEIYDLDFSYVLGEAYGLGVQGNSFKIKPSEIDHIKKYRSLDSYGQETVSYILDREAERINTHGKISDYRVLNLIELSPVTDKTKTLPYWQEGAAAGSGIYQLNDTECIQLKLIDTPITRQADFIINVSGKSMEPDYHDGDKVLVSQKTVVQMGEVGIFIKNGKSYIKELGTMELISRNPESDNIPVNEFDNVVCLGKVIGKVTDDMVIHD